MDKNLVHIIERCQKADRKAQQALFTYLGSKLMAVCTRFTYSRTEAQDCLQESFIKIFTAINKYDFSGPFEGWARTITINETLNYLRKNKKYKLHVKIDEIVDEIPFSTVTFEHLNEKDLLNMINILPFACKTVFNLFAIEGYSHMEIGKMLDINETTSRSYLLRARAQLKKMHEKLNYITTDESND